MLRTHGKNIDLLIVDRTEADYADLISAAERDGFQCLQVTTVSTALQIATQHVVLAWLVNLQLDEMDGTELLRIVKARQPQTPFNLVSDVYSTSDELAARTAGATSYLSKPLSITLFELCLSIPANSLHDGTPRALR